MYFFLIHTMHSFQSQVLGNQNTEPGWLAGEINGHTGWFPESYAEKCDDEEVAVEEPVISEAQSKYVVINNFLLLILSPLN